MVKRYIARASDVRDIVSDPRPRPPVYHRGSVQPAPSSLAHAQELSGCHTRVPTNTPRDIHRIQRPAVTFTGAVSHARNLEAPTTPRGR